MERPISDEYPRLSIVIPARNEERFIAQTIGFILDQDYPPDRMEIIVVVADSVDRTAEVMRKIAAQESRVKFLRNPYGLSSGARTIGAQQATGDIVVFIDSHVFIDNNQLLRSTVRLMTEKQVSILSRPQLMDTPHNTFFQRAVSLARNSWIGHGRDSTIYSREDKYVDPGSSGASYRREVFEKVGYFDTSFDACEDVEFNYRCARAGFQSFTSMKLAVYYYPRTSLRGLFQQMMRYGTGRVRLAMKHPKTLSITTFFPVLLILGLPLLGLLGLFWLPTHYLFTALLLAYLAALMFSSIALAARHGWAYIFVLPAIYLIIHTGLGWGFLRELIVRLFGLHKKVD
jgi:succinoglycan biosynthesis protein ExoA